MFKKRVIRILKWTLGIFLGLVTLITLLLYIYKDDICNIVIGEVNKHLKTKVAVAEVDLAFWGSFPNLSVDFNQVFIRDSYEGATDLDTLLYSNRIRLQFNPLDIWRENYTLKSIEVDPGVLKLKVNDEGLTNYDILAENPDSLESEEFDLNLELVEFENFRFSYINHATDQEYNTLIKTMDVEGAFSTSVFTAAAKSDLHIISARSGNIVLVSDKPATLNIGVHVNKDSSTVTIPKSTIFISELPFDFHGHVTDSTFLFNLKGKDIKIQEAANKLAMKETGEVKKFSGQGALLFDLTINGGNDPIQPVSVDCNFGVSNGTLVDPTSGITLSKVGLEGMYTNKGGPKAEKLELKNISFNTKGGPFRGQLLLTNFKNPIFQGFADGTLNLAVVHSLFNMPSVQTLTGVVDVHSDFKVQGTADAAGEMTYSIDRCTGNMRLKEVNAQLVDDKRVFESINGMVFLRNDEAGLENIRLKIANSDFTINGVFKDIVNYFSGQGDLLANVDITSKRIVIEELDNSTKEEKIQQDRAYVLPNNIAGSVYLNVAKMTYEKHTFENLVGSMSVSKRTLHFPRFSVRNGGADIHGSLTITERTPEIFVINSQLVSNNLNFKELFNEWDDFHQEVIKSDNISGNAQANVQFEAPFDLRSGIISNAIVARIGIQIDDGRLKGVKAFDDMVASLRKSGVKFVLSEPEIDELSKRLKDLKFKQLNNTILIKDGVAELPSMLVESSALNMHVSGTHSFENMIDYKFAFNLRDLKMKEQSEFGEIMDDGEGIMIYLRMYGHLDNPNYKWDKDSRKANTKANIEEEKRNFKAMMKSEFGLYKKDSTVEAYKEGDKTHEELIIQFDPMKEIDTVINVKPPKRDTKINRLLQKWKKEAEEEEEIELDLGGD